jgi:hypothetical protein
MPKISRRRSEGGKEARKEGKTIPTKIHCFDYPIS